MGQPFPQPFQQSPPRAQPCPPYAPVAEANPKKPKKKRRGLIVLGAVLLALALTVAGLVVFARGTLGRATKADYLEFDGDRVASVKLALGEKREIVGINTSADILSSMFGTTKTWVYQVPGTQQNRDMSAYYDYLCDKDGFSLAETANFDDPSGEAFLERNSVDSGYQLILTLKYDESGYAITIRKLQGEVAPAEREKTEPWNGGGETSAQANVPGEQVTEQRVVLPSGWEGLYTGALVGGKPEGDGTFVWESGSTYTGTWANGIRSGQGTFTWATGDKYTGQWLNDKKNGRGTLTWASGSKYVGEYKDDLMDGQGTYTWASGDQYVGGWKDDKRDGQGTVYNADGTVQQQGQWQDGEFVG